MLDWFDGWSRGFKDCLADVPVKYAIPIKDSTPKDGWMYQASDELCVGNKRITDKDIPAPVRHLLSTMPRPYSRALAGGALRDIALGKEPTDYDIFTNTPFQEIVMFLKDSAFVDESSIYQVVASGGSKGPEYGGPVHYVLEFSLYDEDKPIQIIGVNNVNDHVLNNMAVSTSQAMYNEHGFFATSLFVGSIQERKIIITNYDTMSEAYAYKMRKRLPNFDWLAY